MIDAAARPAGRLAARVPVLVYVAWAVTFVWLLGGGRYRAYLRPSLWPFLVLGLVITLGFLASALLSRPSGQHGHGGTETWLRAVLLLLPLAYLGAAHGRTLGTYALTRRSIQPTPRAEPPARPATHVTTAPAKTPATATLPAPQPPKAPDKPISLSKLADDRDAYRGKLILTEGLVYKGEDLPKGYFLVFRFLIVCCAADAQPVGILVAAKDLDPLENDDWVRIAGTFGVRQVEGEDAPCIQATTVTRTKAPPAEEQYLYY